MTALKTKVVRKVNLVGQVPHGVTEDLVVTLYPSGKLGLRELRRDKEYTLPLGMLYVRAVMAELAEHKPSPRS